MTTTYSQYLEDFFNCIYKVTTPSDDFRESPEVLELLREFYDSIETRSLCARKRQLLMAMEGAHDPGLLRAALGLADDCDYTELPEGTRALDEIAEEITDFLPDAGDVDYVRDFFAKTVFVSFASTYCNKSNKKVFLKRSVTNNQAWALTYEK